jgi:hypothetical protein
MSWLSFSDDYTHQRVWESMPYEARWMYHCIVEHLTSTRRYDGRTTWVNAMRCSDVPDPEDSLRYLMKVSLVTGNECGDIAVPDIEGFLPPHHRRTENLLPRKRANQAAWRKARCEKGQHSKDCPATTCPVKLAAKEPVTGNESALVAATPGSGRVGTGGEDLKTRTKEVLKDTYATGLPELDPAEIS